MLGLGRGAVSYGEPVTDTVAAGKPLLEKLGWKWCRVQGSLMEEKWAGRSVKAPRHEGMRIQTRVVAEV